MEQYNLNDAIEYRTTVGGKFAAEEGTVAAIYEEGTARRYLVLFTSSTVFHCNRFHYTQYKKWEKETYTKGVLKGMSEEYLRTAEGIGCFFIWADHWNLAKVEPEYSIHELTNKLNDETRS